MAKNSPKSRVSIPLMGALLIVVCGLIASIVYWQGKEDNENENVDTPVASLKAATPLPEMTIPAEFGAAAFEPRMIEDTTCSDPSTISLWDQNQGVSAISVTKKVSGDDQELFSARAAIGKYINKASASELQELGISVDADYQLKDISVLPNVAFAISCFGINALEVSTLDSIVVNTGVARAVVVAEDSGTLENVVDGNRVVYLLVEEGDRYYMLRRAVYTSQVWQDRLTTFAESCGEEDKTSEELSACVSERISKDAELAQRLQLASDQLVKDYSGVKAVISKR